jgi:hypothetical protein
MAPRLSSRPRWASEIDSSFHGLDASHIADGVLRGTREFFANMAKQPG